MVARIRAQAQQLVFKAREAEAAGDHARWVRLQANWATLMRLALDASPMCR